MSTALWDVPAEADPAWRLPPERHRSKRRLVGAVVFVAAGDLAGFLRPAAAWTARQLPGHAAPVTSALARALLLPVTAPPSVSSRPPGTVG